MADRPRVGIARLLDRPIAFHRCLVGPAGGAVPALMLSQALYWTNITTNEDGWFYKTVDDWEKETGLRRSEQENARRSLRGSGFWEEKLDGLPAKMHFRVNQDALEDSLGIPVPEKSRFNTERTIEVYGSKLRQLSKAAFQRATKAGVEAEHIQYEDVLRRDDCVCYLCNLPITRGPGMRRGYLQFDHVVPICDGGPHVLENVRATHAGCNLGRRVGRMSKPKASTPQYSVLGGGSTADSIATVQRTLHGTESTSETTPEITRENAHARGEATGRDYAALGAYFGRQASPKDVDAWIRFKRQWNGKLTPAVVSECALKARDACVERTGKNPYSMAWLVNEVTNRLNPAKKTNGSGSTNNSFPNRESRTERKAPVPKPVTFYYGDADDIERRGDFWEAVAVAEKYCECVAVAQGEEGLTKEYHARFRASAGTADPPSGAGGGAGGPGVRDDGLRPDGHRGGAAAPPG